VRAEGLAEGELPLGGTGRRPQAAPMTADLERRFGGLRRLYGDGGYSRLRAARVAVVGVGGVGSWAAEALARCGVASLTLIDMDHVAESNINRQVQALGATLGQAKVQALAERIADIHPGCDVHRVEAFADADNWPALLPHAVDAVIDACDQVRAKQVLAAWARQHAVTAFVCVGAAGGKQLPQQVQVDDLANATHDPLLAALRQRLRKSDEAPRTGAIGVRCVFSREPVRLPEQAVCATDVEANLNCHGYGSSVMVTAAFGLTAASDVVQQLLVRTLDKATAAVPL
jgi:tRNA threonylcarbamoyladenosine dehydratase